YDVLKNRYGYTDANIYFYFCDTHSNNSRVDGVSTKANVQAALNTLKTKMKPGDRLFCYFVGHGAYAGGVSTYNTVGADMTDAELNSWRQGLPTEQTYVFTQCYSGHFCNALAAPNTVVITSCTSGETNWKAFAEPIRDAFNMAAGADANNDGKVSVGEAYNYALNNVKQQYGTAALLEHCQCEDNGDGTSSYVVLPTAAHGTHSLNRWLK
ncbi:MAG: caspase family protein, partial [Armatimonadetes bacterium]|nr:caspase family protein [Armatimonadota bacterium]